MAARSAEIGAAARRTARIASHRKKMRIIAFQRQKKQRQHGSTRAGQPLEATCPPRSVRWPSQDAVAALCGEAAMVLSSVVDGSTVC